MLIFLAVIGLISFFVFGVLTAMILDDIRAQVTQANATIQTLAAQIGNDIPPAGAQEILTGLQGINASLSALVTPPAP